MSRFGALNEQTKNKNKKNQQQPQRKQKSQNSFKGGANKQSSRFNNLMEPIKEKSQERQKNTLKRPSVVEDKTVEKPDLDKKELFPELIKVNNVSKASVMNYANVINKVETTVKEVKHTLKPGWIYLTKECIDNYWQEQRENKKQNQMEHHDILCNKMLRNLNIRHNNDRIMREFLGEMFYPNDIENKYEKMSEDQLIKLLLKNSKQLMNDTSSKYRDTQYDLIRHINGIESKMQAMAEESMESNEHLYNKDEEY